MPDSYRACPMCFFPCGVFAERLFCDNCGWIEDAHPALPEGHEIIVGLDLGQMQDFTALVAVDRLVRLGGIFYGTKLIHRFPLQTSYPIMVDHVTKLLGAGEYTRARLVVDHTGVGRPVVDMFRANDDISSRIVPVTITGGQAVTFHDGSWHVAKKHLVGSLQAILSSKRLQISRTMENAMAMVKEMQMFRIKTNAIGNESQSSWRERDHDDMVLAMALAVWWGSSREVAQVENLGGGR